MNIQSLGFVEVRGAANAIAVADAMIKSSNVRILTESRLDPGQVTIIVEGDLGACHAAVEIGADVARQHDCLVAVLLKGKPDPAIETFLNTAGPTPAPTPASTKPRLRRAVADHAESENTDKSREGAAQAGAGPAGSLGAQSPDLPHDPAAVVGTALTPDAPPATGEDAAARRASAPSIARRAFPSDAVLAFIAAGENGRTVAQIARAFKVGAKAARVWVGELVDQEKIERFNRGVRILDNKDT